MKQTEESPMSAIFIAGFGLWLLAKASKALMLQALVSLIVFFPVKRY
jgi:hypothetical protein